VGIGHKLIPQVYTVFIAENLQAFILAVTDCKTFIATKWLIAAQLSVFMPLAMIRNLAKLSGTALIADVFILIGSECLFRRPAQLWRK
jgi:proton-coupled amino acid transporter